MHVKLKVENDIKIKELIMKIVQIRETNIDINLIKTEIVIFQSSQQKNMRGMFYPDYKLSNYNLLG